MVLKVDEVCRAGLELGLDERKVVAHRLLASLEDEASRPETDAAWREEIGSRADDILDGRVELVSTEQSRARVKAVLAESPE